MPSRHPTVEGTIRDDLVGILELLNEQLLIELGKPAPGANRLPKAKVLPKSRVGSWHAEHNRLLLGRRKGVDKP